MPCASQSLKAGDVVGGQSYSERDVLRHEHHSSDVAPLIQHADGLAAEKDRKRGVARWLQQIISDQPGLSRAVQRNPINEVYRGKRTPLSITLTGSKEMPLSVLTCMLRL